MAIFNSYAKLPEGNLNIVNMGFCQLSQKTGIEPANKGIERSNIVISLGKNGDAQNCDFKKN